MVLLPWPLWFFQTDRQFQAIEGDIKRALVPLLKVAGTFTEVKDNTHQLDVPESRGLLFEGISLMAESIVQLNLMRVGVVVFFGSLKLRSCT